jgi:hypothetical protein
MSRLGPFKYAFEAITDDVQEQNDLIFRGDLLIEIVTMLAISKPEQIDLIDAETLRLIRRGELHVLDAETLVKTAGLLGFRVLPRLEEIEILGVDS